MTSPKIFPCIASPLIAPVKFELDYDEANGDVDLFGRVPGKQREIIASIGGDGKLTLYALFSASDRYVSTNSSCLADLLSTDARGQIEVKFAGDVA